jgi:hypothetical protein
MFNLNSYWDTTTSAEAVEASVNNIRQQLLATHAGVPTEDSGNWLRLSALGKEPCVLGCNHPEVRKQLVAQGLWRDAYAFEEKVKLTFSLGHYIEELILLLLQRAGYTILEQQTEVQWCGVVGHIDAIVGCPDGTEKLVEIKSMNDRYYNQCVSYGVDDSRGYLTQLSAYSEALDMDAVWIVCNKNNSDVSFIELDYDKGAARLDVVECYLDLLKSLTCCDDLYKLPAPELVPEVHKKAQTGRMLVPQSLKYFAMRDLFINVTVEDNGYGKSTEYCTLRDEFIPF